MSKKRYLQKNAFPLTAFLVSVSGFAFFYLIPFVVSAVYAFTKNPIQKDFVGLKNFSSLFSNEFFLRGLSNTCLFMLSAIPVGMICSLLLALALQRLSKSNGIAAAVLTVFFLMPLVVPSAAVVNYWTKWISEDKAEYYFFIIVLIYVWKNMGYNAILFMTGLQGIPEEYYQCAAVFGANGWQQFWKITRVYLTPVFFLTFIMSFVNAFKIFREVYLIWHDYPPKEVYLLQHFVNSTLLSMHYEKLVSAVYVLTLGIVGVVGVAFLLERKYSRELSV